MLPEMWPLVRDLLGGAAAVSLEETKSAIRTLIERVHIVAEGAGAVPVAAALSGHECFGTILDWHAEPEVRLAFDHLGGEPRNTDLLVRAHDTYGEFLVAVEAKADEPFGETVAETLGAAAERRLANPRSRGVERVQALAAALFGPRRKGEAPLGELRYQLLTAVAGAVAEGGRRGTQRVVFLVHEFRTRKTKDGNHAANARDLDAFVYRLSHGAVPQILPGKLHGPIQVPRSDMFPRVPGLFISKAICDLRAR